MVLNNVWAMAPCAQNLPRWVSMEPPLPVLHLYAQPDDLAYLSAQESFAAAHSWFHVRKLKAQSHFPMFEVPDEMASAIEQFVGLS